MADRTEHLLEKYWAGESSLEEEKELRDLLKTTDLFTVEKGFFAELDQLREESPQRIQKPQRSVFGAEWLKIAAVFALFLAMTAVVFQYQMYQERQEEAQAYAQVMEAFSLINHHMQKGTSQMEAMEEFRHLNATHELFDHKE